MYFVILCICPFLAHWFAGKTFVKEGLLWHEHSFVCKYEDTGTCGFFNEIKNIAKMYSLCQVPGNIFYSCIYCCSALDAMVKFVSYCIQKSCGSKYEIQNSVYLNIYRTYVSWKIAINILLYLHLVAGQHGLEP